jgi:hypothetical protein
MVFDSNDPNRWRAPEMEQPNPEPKGRNCPRQLTLQLTKNLWQSGQEGQVTAEKATFIAYLVACP